MLGERSEDPIGSRSGGGDCARRGAAHGSVERTGEAADNAIGYYERRGLHPILPDSGGPDPRPDLYRSITIQTYGSHLLWPYLDLLDARLLPAYFARLAARPSVGGGATTLVQTFRTLTHTRLATAFAPMLVVSNGNPTTLHATA